MSRCVKIYTNEFAHLAKSENGSYFWRHWISSIYGRILTPWRKVKIHSINRSQCMLESNIGEEYLHTTLEIRFLIEGTRHTETINFYDTVLCADRTPNKLRLPNA